MGRFIHINNGQKTIYTTGEDLTSISPEASTYFVGVDSTNGSFEKLNPDGSVISLEAGSIVSTTYSDLMTLIGTSGLTPGTYYEISDYETIYDQPDFFVNEAPKNDPAITVKTGPIDSLIFLAIAVDKISEFGYQKNKPKNKIKYDISVSTTEYTTSPAKGRITELVDGTNNNRTDYDHETVVFKRYQNYTRNTQLTGTISDYNSNTGIMSGVGTTFLSDLNAGDIILIDSLTTFSYNFGVYVATVVDDTTLNVYVDLNFGGSLIFTSQSLNYYSSTATGLYNSYKEIYVAQSDLNDFTEILTFEGTTSNNYLGDSLLYNSPFYLSNNVFETDSIDNKIGIYSVNNHLGTSFQNNAIGQSFQNNVIGTYFQSNVITGSFYFNNIANYFQLNTVGWSFNTNTIGDSFQTNVIGNKFENNTITTNFIGNTIGDYFRYNTISSDFKYNQIGNFFGNQGGNINNSIGSNFNSNKIGNFFGNDFNFPTVGGGTDNDGGNTIGDNFQFNTIGDNFIFNVTDVYFEYNKVGNNAWVNIFGQYNSDNVIGELFVGNVGNAGFPDPIGDGFISNKIGNYTAYNKIGVGFAYNQVGDYFGNAGVGTENTIGSSFVNNVIGNYFGDDGSHLAGGNIVGNDFRQNIIQTNTLTSIDFNANPATHVYGDYTCTIFKRSDATNRLSYYDNTDTLTITDPDL